MKEQLISWTLELVDFASQTQSPLSSGALLQTCETHCLKLPSPLNIFRRIERRPVNPQVPGFEPRSGSQD
jgi:hypothetical protein